MERNGTHDSDEWQPRKVRSGCYQNFVTRSMEIQSKFGEWYRGYRYLIEPLTESVDIQTIPAFLGDIPPRSVQNLINLVGGKLSNRPKTAGVVYANWEVTQSRMEYEEVYHGLDTRYGDHAKRQMKTFGKKAPQRSGRRGMRRNRPKFMRGSEGFPVWRNGHRENEHYSREEVIRAINTLKVRKPAGFISHEDRA